jgi:hypothetical protein
MEGEEGERGDGGGGKKRRGMSPLLWISLLPAQVYFVPTFYISPLHIGE